MSYEHRCRQCGKHLALADLTCSACGEPVPAADRRRLLQDRAESLAEAGNYAEAARSMEAVLRQEIPAEEARFLWRKRGIWLQRTGRPELLDAAEASLAEALRLGDNDDLSHQLWIDLLSKRGYLEKARAWYGHRLELNPGDVMAQRQLSIIKLSADFKSAPRPKLELETGRQSLFAKAFKPTNLKVGGAAINVLVNAVLWLRALSAAPAGISGDEASGVGQFSAFLGILNDPWLPGIQVLLFGAYLIWAWRVRRG
jgi:tetratricopeptide (TPR) repeat protein